MSRGASRGRGRGRGRGGGPGGGGGGSIGMNGIQPVAGVGTLSMAEWGEAMKAPNKHSGMLFPVSRLFVSLSIDFDPTIND